MNNNIQDPNNQATTQQVQQPVQQVEAPFDPRTVQPAVIGELRKDRIGKPILVLEMLVMFGIVLVALPLIHTIVNDEKSPVYKWLHKDDGTVIVDPEPTQQEYLDGSKIQVLSMNSAMKANGIVIQNFKVSENSISCRIYTINEKIDFDTEEYYFEIYSNTQTKQAAVKLSGIYDYQPKDTVLTAGGLKFNGNQQYYGKIVKMDDALYPEVKYEKDKNEIGSITCTSGTHILKYTFKNDYLLSIDDLYKVVKADYDDNKYQDLYGEYLRKSSELGAGVAKAEEDADGCTVSASLNLEGDYTVPESIKDNNYYKKDTKAKVIVYAETGKGFECE